MDMEHAFQQSGFYVALQLLIIGSVLAPGAIGGAALYQRFARIIAGHVITFGPFVILVYMLYRVSQLG